MVPGLRALAALILPLAAFAGAAVAGDAAAQSPDRADIVEALFMGSGPVMPTDGAAACPYRRFWNGFPRGTDVTIVVSTVVPAAVTDALRAAIRQVHNATDGAIQATLTLTAARNPMPEVNQVTFTLHPDPVSQGYPRRGCTMHDFARPGVFRAGRVVQLPGVPVNAYVHDVIGHGVMGMCHIDGNLIGGAANSLMSGGPGVFSGQIAVRLTPLDLTAARAVYRSPLSPGATRRDFVRSGLINER